MLAPLGTKVTVVERRPTMLEFCDDEIVEGLRHHLRDQGLVFASARSCSERQNAGTVTTLASGKRIAADAVFYSAGRQGATNDLGLDVVGLEVDERGRIPVDGNFRTAVPHIFAVGDVIGFPSLAGDIDGAGSPGGSSTRSARRRGSCQSCFRFGIYTIP